MSCFCQNYWVSYYYDLDQLKAYSSNYKAIYGPSLSDILTALFLSCVLLVCVLLRRAGRRSIICLEERRRSALWRWCLRCITSSPRRSTSWMRLMLPLTSRTSPSWPATYMYVPLHYSPVRYTSLYTLLFLVLVFVF